MTGFMLAIKGTAADLTREGWIVDEKLDGWRCLVVKQGHRVTLTSRKGTPLTAMAPEVVAAVRELPVDDCVLDAELVTYDVDGVAKLPLMLHRLPRSLVAFDVLEANGHDLREMPLLERKRILGVVVGPLRSKVMRVSRWAYAGYKGEALYHAITRVGGEGVVCKLADSAYVDGRSAMWTKWKPHYSAESTVTTP